MRSSLLWKLSTQRKRLKRHARNKARERWNNKEEINKGPTTDVVGASFLEIPTSHFAATPQSDVLLICAHDFQRHGRRFRCDRQCLFTCIYNPQITIWPTSLFSANFNGNRVKNHPQPWTCPLTMLCCEPGLGLNKALRALPAAGNSYSLHAVPDFKIKHKIRWRGVGGGGGSTNSRLQATHAKLRSDLTQAHSRASLTALFSTELSFPTPTPHTHGFPSRTAIVQKPHSVTNSYDDDNN